MIKKEIEIPFEVGTEVYGLDEQEGYLSTAFYITKHKIEGYFYDGVGTLTPYELNYGNCEPFYETNLFTTEQEAYEHMVEISRKRDLTLLKITSKNQSYYVLAGYEFTINTIYGDNQVKIEILRTWGD